MFPHPGRLPAIISPNRGRRVSNQLKPNESSLRQGGKREPPATELPEVGGEAGIRTLGTRKGTTVFETAPIDRSGTSPVTQAQAPVASDASPIR